MTIPARSKQRTKNQHYVPRLHLRKFVGDEPKNVIWTYDKVRGTVRSSTVENTGAEQNFYSIKQDDGTYFDELDDWLTSVEGAAVAPYEALLRGEFPSGQARMDFAVFVAALFARSPALIRAHAEAFAQAIQIEMDMRFSDRKRFEAFIDRYVEDTGVDVGDRDKLFAFCNDKERFWLEISQKRGLRILGVADKICGYLFERNWYLIHASQDFFITCDNPVFRFVDPQQYHSIYGDGGFKNPASEVTLPLSPSLYLLITGHTLPERAFQIPGERVWAMNGSRAYNSERCLYSPVRDDRVRELAELHKDDRPRMTIGWPKDFAEVKVTR